MGVAVVLTPREKQQKGQTMKTTAQKIADMFNNDKHCLETSDGSGLYEVCDSHANRHYQDDPFSRTIRWAFADDSAIVCYDEKTWEFGYSTACCCSRETGHSKDCRFNPSWNAGRLSRDWHLSNMRNGGRCGVERLLEVAGDYQQVTIKMDMAVSADGQWLTQNRIDQLVATIDAKTTAQKIAAIEDRQLNTPEPGAGYISRDWYANSLNNQSHYGIQEWFEIAGNYHEVIIMDDMTVSADNQWLSQDRIDQLVATIEAGI